MAFWFPFAVVFFEIATYLANDMYLPGLPMLMKDLQISESIAKDTLLYWFLGSASMQLLVGPLSDKYGRKIMLLLGAIFYTLTSFICANTSQVILFLICRFIQGCTICCVVVAGYSAVHEHYETRLAIKIVSIMGSIVILAPAFGPILGAIVLEFSDWRMIFTLLGISGVVSFILLAMVTPQTQRERFPLHLKTIFKDYWAIATRKHFLVFTLPFCFMFLSMICWVVETPFLIIQGYQKSTMEYGLIQLYVFGAFIIGAQITGQLVHRVHPLKLIRIGLCIGLVASILFAIVSYLKCPLWMLVIAMMLTSLGFAMTFGPFSRFAIEVCQEPMGRRMAIFSSYMSFFGVIATLLVSVSDHETMGDLSLMVFFGALCAAILYFMMKKPTDLPL